MPAEPRAFSSLPAPACSKRPSKRLFLTQEFAICTVVVCAPGSEAPLQIQSVCKIDIRFAVQQIPEVETRSLQVDRVDLKVTPIERAVGVVVIDLAISTRILARWMARATRHAEPNCRQA